MNWPDFLLDNGIEYVTRGPNTARDNISVRCPWCADDDPSQHMGISLTKDAFGCLRDPSHRGVDPAILVRAIIGCSGSQAQAIVKQYSASDPGGLEGAIMSLERTSEAPSPDKGLPEEVPAFRRIAPDGVTGKFWHYLRNRGFDNLKTLIQLYNLKCCVTGKYKDRVIVPFHRDGAMVAWTGRAITDPKEAPRYLSSNLIKKVVWNEDLLQEGGKLLFVCEGPFDAMKMDFYGRKQGARATCTSGTTVSMDQIVTLRRLCKKFDRVLVMFDRDAVGPAFMAMDWLYGLNVYFGHIPEGVKDPGEMTEEQIKYLTR